MENQKITLARYIVEIIVARVIIMILYEYKHIFENITAFVDNARMR